MSRPPDDEWIGQLYDRYGVALYRYAVMVLADPAAAADVVQTVFVELLRRREPPDSGERYLRRAVRNECFSALRRRRHDVLAATTPILEGVEAGRECPDERLALERALRALPPEQREVVHLKLFEGMTFQEDRRHDGRVDQHGGEPLSLRDREAAGAPDMSDVEDRLSRYRPADPPPDLRGASCALPPRRPAQTSFASGCRRSLPPQ